MKTKAILLIGLFVFVIALSGCTQPSTQYVCSDGTEVLDSSDCFQQIPDDNLLKENNLSVEIETFGGELKVIGVVDANPLGQFALNLHKIDSAVLNYELRRCTYTEQTIYRDINRPMVSIHSLEETSERDMPLMVVYENTNGYVETNYVPVTQFLLANETDKNTGRILFELDEEIQGDLFISYPEIASFGSMIVKSPGFDRWDENYSYFAEKKYYFYDQNENLIFADTNRLFNNKTPLEEGEISLDDFYNVNFLPLCNSALDYIVVDDYENGGEKRVSCKHAFKKFEIDNVSPKELLLIPVYYYPFSRVSYEQKYPLDPPSLWPLKEQQDGNVLINISVKYPKIEEKGLLQVKLKLDLKEYSYDIYDNYCVPKN